MRPHYERDGIRIYCGNVVDVLPKLLADGTRFDMAHCDTPYERTSCAWDRWTRGWPSLAAGALKPSGSLWCWGSLGMFMDHAAEFSGELRRAQEMIWGETLEDWQVWEKHNGSGAAADRLRCVHEIAAHFYRSDSKWSGVYNEPQVTLDARKRIARRKWRPVHWGESGASSYASADGGPRLLQSIIYARSLHGAAENETEKPLEVVMPLVRTSCPRGGALLSLFSGTGPELQAAWLLGLTAVAVELRPEQCDIAARKISELLPNTRGSLAVAPAVRPVESAQLHLVGN